MGLLQTDQADKKNRYSPWRKAEGRTSLALPTTAQVNRHCASIDNRIDTPGCPLCRATGLACSDALSDRVPLITVAHAQRTSS